MSGYIENVVKEVDRLLDNTGLSYMTDEPMQSSFSNRILDVTITINNYKVTERLNDKHPAPHENVAFTMVRNAFVSYLLAK